MLSVSFLLVCKGFSCILDISYYKKCVNYKLQSILFLHPFHYLMTSVVSVEKSCFSKDNMSLYSGLLKNFIFVVGFPQFECNVPKCGFIFV